MTQTELITALSKCKTWKQDLTPVLRLAAKMGDPQKKLKILHVAGTNGKGSTCAMLAAVLQQAGYRTGRFVSPYVLEFRERIVVDDEMIPEQELCAIGEEVLAAVAELAQEDVYPTEFDVVTVMGLLWFVRSNCDAAVLEVGLGGRIDSTNIVEGDAVACSAITSIALDHTAVLGDTLARIAAEKSGILKENGTLVVNSTIPDEAMAVILAEAKAKNVQVIPARADALQLLESTPAGLRLQYGARELHLPLPGLYQQQNAAVALAMLEELCRQGWHITEEQIAAGLSSVRFPARMELLGDQPLFWLDGAHNPEGITALVQSLERLAPGKKRVCIHGMMEDKDVPSSVAMLSKAFDCAVTVTPDNPRAMGSGALRDIWQDNGVETVSVGGDMAAAVAQAVALAGEDGAVVCCGSLFLCADLRPHARAYYEEK